MTNWINRLRLLEKRISQERGSFSLFALFLREEAPGVWDLVVAATWLPSNRSRALRMLAPLVQEALGPDDVLKLSKIVIADPDSQDVRDINDSVPVEHGAEEMRDVELFGMDMRRAYIITSSRADTVHGRKSPA